MAAALLLAADSSLGRTWTSADGAYTVEAKLVEQSDTAVKLRKQDGRVIVVPFAQLVRSDEQPIGAPDDGLGLTEVWGYGVRFPAGRSGWFYMNRVRLETP